MRVFGARAEKAAEVSNHLMEDSQVVEEFLKTKDPDLFEMLVDRYKNRVFRLVVSILGPGFIAEAEEVTQEVFINVYCQLSTFRLESQFGSWLYRVAYNRAIDEKRKARLHIPHLSDEALVSVPAERKGSSPFTKAAEREQRRAIRACIGQLPDVYQAVLYLFYWLGCTVEEIAGYLCMNPGTVKSYMYRARRRLYAQMKRKGLVHG